MTDEAEAQPESSISFTPKRTHRDDLQIIPQPATTTGHEEVPSTSSRQQEIINKCAGVNQGNPLSKVELWLRATPSASTMTIPQRSNRDFVAKCSSHLEDMLLIHNADLM